MKRYNVIFGTSEDADQGMKELTWIAQRCGARYVPNFSTRRIRILSPAKYNLSEIHADMMKEEGIIQCIPLPIRANLDRIMRMPGEMDATPLRNSILNQLKELDRITAMKEYAKNWREKMSAVGKCPSD